MNKIKAIRDGLKTARELEDNSTFRKTCDLPYDCQGNRGVYGIRVNNTGIDIFYGGKELEMTDNEARHILEMLKNLYGESSNEKTP